MTASDGSVAPAGPATDVIIERFRFAFRAIALIDLAVLGLAAWSSLLLMEILNQQLTIVRLLKLEYDPCLGPAIGYEAMILVAILLGSPVLFALLIDFCFRRRVSPSLLAVEFVTACSVLVLLSGLVGWVMLIRAHSDRSGDFDPIGLYDGRWQQRNCS